MVGLAAASQVIPSEELRHLLQGAGGAELTGGVGTIAVIGKRRGRGNDILARARDVMSVILNEAEFLWPSPEVWRDKLPAWFVEATGPEKSGEELDQWLEGWRSLPPEAQARADAEQLWTLGDWLFWLEPSERQWFWWDATLVDRDTVRVVVQVSGWPAPLGALDWLLRAAGASEVVHEPAELFE